MQACRLSIAEAHPSQVVKALFDIRSHCAAFLLADSSCLLVSSLSVENRPLLIPPSCTDVCFLRLQARQPAGNLLLPPSPFSSSSSSSCSSERSAGTARAFAEGLKGQTDATVKEAALETLGFEGEEGEAAQKRGVGKHAGGERSVRQGMGSDGKLGDGPRVRVSRYRAGDASRGKLLFLSAMPAKGGSCTDLKAWSCDLPAFVRTPIQLEGWGHWDPHSHANQLSAAEKTVARLDAPHGVAVNIAASVNVVVLYSPSVGKVWIMSARLSGGQGMGQDVASSARISGSRELLEGASELADENCFKGAAQNNSPYCDFHCVREELKEEEKDRQGSLYLIKCAVVDCNGPVHALHLSLQHLLLGQVGGLRVWPLRPLIKGFKLRKKNQCPEEKADIGRGNWIGKVGVAAERTKVPNSGESVKKVADRFRSFYDIEASAACEGIGCEKVQERKAKAQCFSKAEPKNGFYEVEGSRNILGNVEVGMNSSVCGVRLDGSKYHGCWSGSITRKQEDSEINDRSNAVGESDGWKTRHSVGVDIAQLGNGTSDLQLELSSASKTSDQDSATEQGWQLAVPQCRNGMLFCEAYDSEDWHSQHILSQSSIFSSSSSSSSFPVSSSCSALVASSHTIQTAAGARSFPCPCSASSSSSSSSSSVAAAAALTASLLSSMEIAGGSHTLMSQRTNFVKGREGIFVPFQSGNKHVDASQLRANLARSEQAIGIQALSEREFVVLDSLGNLHLLTLQHSAVAGDDRKELRGTRVAVDTCLRPLSCSMRVKMLTAPPLCLQNAAASAYAASRKLWVSDGGHTIYIVSLPETYVSEEGGEKNKGEPRHLTVAQSIFTTEHVRSISAVSVNTMMVLTEGSILAYSIAGT